MNPQPCTLRGAPQAAPLLYGSVCSGIEAVSLAWQPLGLKAAWFAEIEPFPSAVLAHRYPHVPNLGDMTAIARQVRAGTVPAPDILVGGTPCQSFSVAGARQGLNDPRGALTLAYVELANAIDQTRHQDRRPPATLVWENVPGVLNDRSNAFGHFLGALAGESRALQPPGEKWAHAGCVSGPRRRIAWRVLDAQYFGVAQRRKRVFLVACGGDEVVETGRGCLQVCGRTRGGAGVSGGGRERRERFTAEAIDDHHCRFQILQVTRSAQRRDAVFD
ncbi:DNA cytosine methyltransferase, partial [Serratia bockelmannii]|uniref:DNA cytosine methyltransferase n=1 Tax=Serratia bockelmannii TaxID=2703793 RepID=UPI003D077034